VTPVLRRIALAVAASLLLCAAAADPADRLPNPAQEERAHAIFADVRCLVCQSESIDDSDAPLAHDLRQLIRRQVADGRTDDQIKSFLVARYGQFVLLTPKQSLGNAVLWIGPLLVIVLGAVALWRRRRAAPEPANLSVQEETAIADLSRDEML
jgi:cytochrome c-type biogenesis protein CcmH